MSIENLEAKLLGLSLDSAVKILKDSGVRYVLEKTEGKQTEKDYIPRVTRIKERDETYVLTYSYFKPGKGGASNGVQNHR